MVKRGDITRRMLWILLFVPWIHALHPDQAGLFDWHISLVGSPQHAHFHRHSQHPLSLLVATDQQMVASISPKTGDLLWRKNVKGVPVGWNVDGDHGLVWTDQGRVMMVNVTSGDVIWYHDGVDGGDGGDEGVLPLMIDWEKTHHGVNVVVLNQRKRMVSRLSVDENGIETVEWVSKGIPASIRFMGMERVKDVYYAIGLTQDDVSNATSTHSVTLLPFSAKDGVIYEPTVFAEEPLPPTASLSDIFIVRDKDLAWVGWCAHQRFYTYQLGRIMDSDESAAAAITGTRLDVVHSEYLIPSIRGKKIVSCTCRALHTAGPGGDGRVVMHVQVEKEKDVYTRIVQLIPGKGVEDKDVPGQFLFTSVGMPVVASVKVDAEEQGVIAKAEITKETHGPLGLELMMMSKDGKSASVVKRNIPMSLERHGRPQKMWVDMKRLEGSIVTFRVLLETSDRSLHFYRGKASVDDATVDTSVALAHAWTRYESLAYAEKLMFVDLPEASHLSLDQDELEEDVRVSESIDPWSKFQRRVKAQYHKLMSFVDMLQGVHPLAATKGGVTDATKGAELVRDNHGARKLLVFASPTSRTLTALDTFPSDPKQRVVWSRFFPGAGCKLASFLTRTVTVKYPPVIAVVLQCPGEAYVYEVNGITGDILFSPRTVDLDVKRIVALPHALIDADERRQGLLLMGVDTSQYTIHPATLRPSDANMPVNVTIAMQEKDKIGMYGLACEIFSASNVRSQLAWGFTLPSKQAIVATAHRPSHDVVASLGRILGDRSVLYKYLNPHALAFASFERTSQAFNTGSLFLYVVDTVSGALLHRHVHHGVRVDASHPVHIVQCEHWITYFFYNAIPSTEPGYINDRGYVAGVLEMFESSIENTRVESDTFSSYEALKPLVTFQSYMLPFTPISAGVTVTLQGITTREIVVGLDTNHVFRISKRLLDPRRPVGTPTDADKEEGLTPYAPVIPFIPQNALSYHQEVMGIKFIESDPSLLESTSLVVAFGQDVFFSLVTPSQTFDMLSEDFNKVMLLVTLVALAFGVAFTGPMVRAKRVKALWK